MPVAGDEAKSKHMTDAAPEQAEQEYVDCLGNPLSRNEDQDFSLVPSMVGLSLSLPQADRELYKKSVQKELKNLENLEIVEGEVTDFDIQNNQIGSVTVGKGEILKAQKVGLI